VGFQTVTCRGFRRRQPHPGRPSGCGRGQHTAYRLRQPGRRVRAPRPTATTSAPPPTLTATAPRQTRPSPCCPSRPRP
jgi:hypothetical protein